MESSIVYLSLHLGAHERRYKLEATLLSGHGPMLQNLFLFRLFQVSNVSLCPHIETHDEVVILAVTFRRHAHL